MTHILPTDPRAFAPGVEYAGGRGDWDAAHPNAKAPDFDPNQPKLGGALAMRKWALRNPPAGDYTYRALMPDGTMQSFTVAGAVLAKPNFAGVANPYEAYDAWLAKQPEPRVFYADSGSPNFSSGMKGFLLDPKTEAQLVAEMRNAGLEVEILPDDGTYTYGEGYAPRYTFAKVNGTPFGVALGHYFTIRSAKGVWAPGQWVIPAKGIAPTFAPDLRMSETVLAEWPVPNEIPAGYKPGIGSSGIVTFAAFLPQETAPAPDGGGAIDLSPVTARIEALHADVRKLALSQGVKL